MLLLLSCLVQVDLWNGHDHFALPGTGLLTQPCFVLCFSLYFTVLLLVLRLVSVAILWLLCLLLAVLFIVSPQLDDERCTASASSLRCSSRCPRTRVALLRSSRHKLFGCGSVSDSHHWLFGCGSVSDPLQRHFVEVRSFLDCFACTSNTTTQHCALRDRSLAVGARAPRSYSLQHLVLLTVKTV